MEKRIRIIARVPFRSHNFIVYLLANCVPPQVSVKLRILKFMRSMLHSESKILCYVSRRCFSQSLSNMGKNMSYLMSTFDMHDFISTESKDGFVKYVSEHIKPAWFQSFTDQQYCNAEICKASFDVQITKDVYNS